MSETQAQASEAENVEVGGNGAAEVPAQAAATESPWKVQVYTGDGKGKTTCSVGLIVRALGSGMKAAFVQFDKGFNGVEHYAERHILRSLPGLDLYPTGCERMRPGQKFRFGVLPEDLAEAQRGLEIVHDLISHPRHQLVVLDEILASIQYHLLKEAQVLDILDRYEAAGRPFELVMTGRRAPQRVLDRVDLVTEMKPLKHYFDTGLGARPGIEY